MRYRASKRANEQRNRTSGKEMENETLGDGREMRKMKAQAINYVTLFFKEPENENERNE